MGWVAKVSLVDRPPSIMRKMTFFAFAGRWGYFGASGFFCCSAASSDVNATLPSDAPSE